MKSQATRGISTLLFFAESNYGGSDRAAEAFKKVMDWSTETPYSVRGVLAHDKARTMPGFWLDEAKKERMAIEMKSFLERDAIMLADEFVAPVMGAKAATEKMMTQMANYERRFKESLSRSGAVLEDTRMPYKYSGKTTSDSDDVVIIMQETLLLVVYNQAGHLRYTEDMPTHIPTVFNPRITKKGTIEDVMAGRIRDQRNIDARLSRYSTDKRQEWEKEKRKRGGLYLPREPQMERELPNNADHADAGDDLDRLTYTQGHMTFEDMIGAY